MFALVPAQCTETAEDSLHRLYFWQTAGPAERKESWKESLRSLLYFSQTAVVGGRDSLRSWLNYWQTAGSAVRKESWKGSLRRPRGFERCFVFAVKRVSL